MNADGEEVNVLLQSKIVLQEKITNCSMFSFKMYGKEGEEKNSYKHGVYRNGCVWMGRGIECMDILYNRTYRRSTTW